MPPPPRTWLVRLPRGGAYPGCSGRRLEWGSFRFRAALHALGAAAPPARALRHPRDGRAALPLPRSPSRAPTVSSAGPREGRAGRREGLAGGPLLCSVSPFGPGGPRRLPGRAGAAGPRAGSGFHPVGPLVVQAVVELPRAGAVWGSRAIRGAGADGAGLRWGVAGCAGWSRGAKACPGARVAAGKPLSDEQRRSVGTFCPRRRRELCVGSWQRAAWVCLLPGFRCVRGPIGLRSVARAWLVFDGIKQRRFACSGLVLRGETRVVLHSFTCHPSSWHGWQQDGKMGARLGWLSAGAKGCWSKGRTASC